jgi:membrane protease YdiL (CAAX protease family)
MPRSVFGLVPEMLRGANLRSTIVLLTSAVCLSAWYVVGKYAFWLEQSGDRILSAIEATAATAIFLGVIPALVVKFILRERLSSYGVQLGRWRFSSLAIFLASPLVIVIGYCTAQVPAFQAMYPINPVALDSATALGWHLFGQIFFYAAWEFHFRGFVQYGLERKTGIGTAICIQALVSTLAHFGRPGSEVFGAILGGLLWGALAWRTRSLLAGFCQHWLLGASLDFFIFRSVSR